VEKQAFVRFGVIYNQMRHEMVCYRSRGHFVPESPIFIIIVFVITITTTTTTTIIIIIIFFFFFFTYICTCLTVIRITTTVTKIRPIAASG
jgi:hypothetical protein